LPGPSVVSAPLKHSVASQPYNFADGISIQKVSPILWDISIAKGYISQHDRDYLSEDRFWLCATAEAQSEHDAPARELYEKARQAAYALQIIAPSGGKNVYLQFRNTGEGFDNVGACHPHQTCRDLLRFDVDDRMNLTDVGAAMLRGFDIPSLRKDIQREIRNQTTLRRAAPAGTPCGPPGQ
jgi:hypothetical protein